jgi:hypothetical protein
VLASELDITLPGTVPWVPWPPNRTRDPPGRPGAGVDVLATLLVGLVGGVVGGALMVISVVVTRAGRLRVRGRHDQGSRSGHGDSSSRVPPGLPARRDSLTGRQHRWLPRPPLSVRQFNGAGQGRTARHARALRLLTVAQVWARVNRERRRMTTVLLAVATYRARSRTLR